jgi:uncharacterized protein
MSDPEGPTADAASDVERRPEERWLRAHVSMAGTNGLPDEVVADLSGVFAAHGVAVAYLFGSRAEGTARPASDHDVAVLFTATEPALDATQRLASDLAGVLGTRVDVVDLDRAGLELRGRVAERGRRLYSVDESRRVRFEVDARLRWIEFRPVVDEITRAYLRRVAAEGLR